MGCLGRHVLPRVCSWSCVGRFLFIVGLATTARSACGTHAAHAARAARAARAPCAAPCLLSLCARVLLKWLMQSAHRTTFPVGCSRVHFGPTFWIMANVTRALDAGLLLLPRGEDSKSVGVWCREWQFVVPTTVAETHYQQAIRVVCGCS